MGPKSDQKGGKKKKKRKSIVDPKALSQVDKTFLELTIDDLVKKIERLTNFNQDLDNENKDKSEQLRELLEDKKDEAADLTRKLESYNKELINLDNRIEVLLKERAHENEQAAQVIHDWETKFRAMHDQKCIEIKSLNGKINELADFRSDYQRFLQRVETFKEDNEEELILEEQQLKDFKQSERFDQYQMCKQIQGRIKDTSAQFFVNLSELHSGFVFRLQRENVSLRKEIDIISLAKIKTDADLMKQEKEYHNMKRHLSKHIELQMSLIDASQRKVQLIELLTSGFESLKDKYLKERSICRSDANATTFNEQCRRFLQRYHLQHFHELKLCKGILRKQYKQLKAENNEIETELSRLRKILQQLKLTVQAELEAGSIDETILASVKNQGFLLTIYALINSIDFPGVALTDIVDTESHSSFIELVELQSSEMNTFFEAPKARQKQEEVKPLPKLDDMYEPTEWPTLETECLDIKWGKMLYISDDSDGEQAVAPVEEEFEEEFVSSDDDDYAPANLSESELVPTQEAQVVEEVPKEIDKPTEPEDNEENEEESNSTESNEEEADSS